MRYLYQWGSGGFTLENPHIETVQDYLDRHKNVFTPLTEQAANEWLGAFRNKQSPNLEWNFNNGPEDWLKFKAAYPILKKADKGQLMDDISIWHTVFSETLIKILIFKYSTEVGKRVRVKVISDVIAKYNLDLVIKDFNPSYVIPESDKGKLVDGLKEIEQYDDGIYQRLAQAVGLESSALHNEVVDKYEEIIQSIHQTQQPVTGHTLASELPVNAGGTQT